MCSITLHKIHVKEMGLLFEGSVLSPFLNKGQTCAFFQTEGSCPLCKVYSNKWHIKGAISILNCFKTSC